MGKRVGLLAGVLVLALGSVVVAQSPSPSGTPLPSPEATPMYAPNRLEFALPARLGGVELKVLGYVGQDSLMLAKGPVRPVLEQVLRDLGKTPDDLRMAVAWADVDDPTGRASFDMAAIRIVGMPGEVVGDLLIREAAEVVGRDVPPAYEWPTVIIDGRVVVTRSEPGDESWKFLYPKGEVLFVAGVTGRLSMEDVLAELP